MLLKDGAGTIDTEIVLHVRSDGATCDDGTPITDTVIADVVPKDLLRVLTRTVSRPTAIPSILSNRAHPTWSPCSTSSTSTAANQAQAGPAPSNRVQVDLVGEELAHTEEDPEQIYHGILARQ